MNIPAELKFTRSHEWIKDLGNGEYEIGISDFAQHELGDLVFVNLPQEGDTITMEEPFADVESVKAVSDIYSPVTAVVKEINEEILDAPETINSGAYDAWFVRVENVTETAELLSAEEYEAFLNEEA
ncbi:MAG: glycine cleavage system protein GcvH [Clostridia bacterium]|nr:glycine cleavage system protein GcvH [Clostridia bacterium]